MLSIFQKSNKSNQVYIIFTSKQQTTTFKSHISTILAIYKKGMQKDSRNKIKRYIALNILSKKKEKDHYNLSLYVYKMVAEEGLEPPTRGL